MELNETTEITSQPDDTADSEDDNSVVTAPRTADAALFVWMLLPVVGICFIFTSLRHLLFQ